MRFTITFERIYCPGHKYHGAIKYLIHKTKSAADPITSFNTIAVGRTTKDLKTATRNATDKLRKWMERKKIDTAEIATEDFIKENK